MPVILSANQTKVDMNLLNAKFVRNAQNIIWDANIDDVKKYMSGTVSHLSSNADKMKELLVTKKAEMTANIGFLKDFLLSRADGSNTAFTEAIKDLATVLGEIDKPASLDTISAFAEQQKVVETQLAALMMTGSVKAETLNKLIDAATLGDHAVFQQLYEEVLDQNKALSAAVNKRKSLRQKARKMQRKQRNATRLQQTHKRIWMWPCQRWKGPWRKSISWRRVRALNSNHSL